MKQTKSSVLGWSALAKLLKPLMSVVDTNFAYDPEDSVAPHIGLAFPSVQGCRFV